MVADSYLNLSLQIGEQGMSIDKMTDDEILQIISGTMKDDDIMSLWKSIFDRGLIYARKSGEWEIEEYGTWIKSPSYTGGVANLSVNTKKRQIKIEYLAESMSIRKTFSVNLNPQQLKTVNTMLCNHNSELIELRDNLNAAAVNLSSGIKEDWDKATEKFKN